MSNNDPENGIWGKVEERHWKTVLGAGLALNLITVNLVLLCIANNFTSSEDLKKQK